ncbi:MAG TPA: hypothetical protein VJR89_25580 [Polyangiales bacterium]|nr:hypothetical protein [Polyangiales bacterium]
MRTTIWLWTVLASGLLGDVVPAHAEPATVRLKNGGSVRGELLEYSPGDHVTLSVGTGRPLQLDAADVRSVSVSSNDSKAVAADAKPSVATRLRLGAGLALGFGGEASARVGDEDEDPTDLLPTLGFALSFEAPVHEYISLGVLAQYGAWNIEPFDDQGIGRSTLWDLALFPRVRHTLVVDNHNLEIYAGLLLGVSHAALNDALELESGTDTAATGLMLGARAGAAYFISDKIGLTAELGYQHNAFTFDASVGDELELSLGQLRLSTGILLVL